MLLMSEKNPDKIRPAWQEYIAEQMNGTINCPRCWLGYETLQPLSQLGDYPEELFCPHCDLELVLKIRYFGRDDL